MNNMNNRTLRVIHNMLQLISSVIVGDFFYIYLETYRDSDECTKQKCLVEMIMQNNIIK